MRNAFRRFVLLAAAGLLAGGASAQSDDPVSFGRKAAADALAARGLKAAVDIKVGGSGLPESYAITFKNGNASVQAPDANGALYGALELAERVASGGAGSAGRRTRPRPAVPPRPRLERLPDAALELREEQYRLRPRALIDPERWWFAERRVLEHALRPDGPGAGSTGSTSTARGTSASPTRPTSTPISSRASNSRRSASRPRSRRPTSRGSIT